MKLLSKNAAILSAVFLAGTAIAGGPEVPMNETGIYVGLGGSYNSVQEAYSGTTDVRLAPYGQVGYFQSVYGPLLFGGKVWYKYLDDDTNHDIDHEGGIMETLGWMFSNSFLYFGAGAAVFGADFNSSSRTLWGGAGQLGWSYYLGTSWMLDLDYTYAITGTYEYGSSSTRYQIRAQEVVASINKVFAV